jgi:hypothetical protein
MLILLPVLLFARAPGVVRLACDAVANLPPTSLLGAILWTGYLGDLLATHFKFF